MPFRLVIGLGTWFRIVFPDDYLEPDLKLEPVFLIAPLASYLNLLFVIGPVELLV